MKLAGSTVLVTGANRGIGAEFVRQLQERGVTTIYATARNTDSITAKGVEKLALDVTDEDQVAGAAAAAPDVQLLINNAGQASGQTLVGGDLATIRRELETNYFGPLLLSRAFAPVLAANGGGAILNVLSALSWFSYPGSSSYSVTKAAAWSLTDGLRAELHAQHTQVVGLHMGAVDTDMTAEWDVPKIDAPTVVRAALDGIEAGQLEVLVDDTARQLKASLTADPAERYAGVLGGAVAV
jgi:NAD(P)-dependent dehydrogenase (short-subunit alcohol dehydrogenase family)